MPCLFAVLVLAFPRVAIALLWFFTTFFNVLHNNLVIGVLGFLFLPLTLIVYTFLLRTNAGHFGTSQLVFLFIAAILDLGLVGGGTLRSRG